MENWIGSQRPCRQFDDLRGRCRTRKKKRDGMTYPTSIYVVVASIPRLPIPGGITKLFWLTIVLPSKGGIDVGGGGAEFQEIGILSPNGTRIAYNYTAWHPEETPTKQYCQTSLQALEAGAYTVILGRDIYFDGFESEGRHDYMLTDGMSMHVTRYLYPQPARPTVPMYGLFNTGQGRFIDHGNAIGTIDPSYFAYDTNGIQQPVLVATKGDPGQNYLRTGENDPVSTWVTAGASRIIMTTFDLTGYDIGSVSLLLKVDVWNVPLFLYLNGTSPLFSDGEEQPIPPPGPDHWRSITISSGFQPGVNTLAFHYTGHIIRVRVAEAIGTLSN